MGWRLRVLAWCALACVVGALGPATAGAAPQRRAIVAFYAASPKDVIVQPAPGQSGSPTDAMLRFLGDQPALRPGLWSSTQGAYQRQQALLDISQGTRQPAGLYSDVDANGDGVLDDLRFDAAARAFTNWQPFRKRAYDVSQTLRPGLLAGSVPGGAAFVGARGALTGPAIVAADQGGHVAAVSSGSVATLAARALAQSSRRRLVVVSVPVGAAGRAQLTRLARERAADELLLVVQLPETPDPRTYTIAPARFLRQPDFAIADGLRGSPTSASTRRDGLVTATDFAPTILTWIGVNPPDDMRGLAIEGGAKVGVARLDALRQRWTSTRDGRQVASFLAIVTLTAILFLLLGTLRDLRTSGRLALRIGALGALWWPTAVLASAAVEPASKTSEVFLIAGLSLVLGAVTERVLPWERAPVVPAAACMLAYTVDLALGGPLLTVSALGPSVAAGSRFYGVSNELEPILPIVLLIGLAALTSGREITRRTMGLYAGAGLALLVVIGWGRLGADVGGVITVGAGVAVATLVMLPGTLTVRRLLIAAVVPVAALAFLIVLDLVLSGGSHLTRNLLRADDSTELWELVTRRYQLAWGILTSGNRPAHFLASVLAVVFAWRNRDRLYASLPHRAWAAALIGGLACGVVGALANDSGPILFINAVVGLAGLTAYLLGRPEVASA
ncbi:MAG TPA: hypothetical protein VHZ31_02220 [Solirubrobacteraceae bacterium]|jgi:hypothetical protein|nr:hypothetical protein [Solirubrobacteraceae bacterium]